MKNQKYTAVIILGWISLWVIPWGQWLAYEGHTLLTVLSDILRLGLAIGLFIVPGILLFWILFPPKDARFGITALIPIGFTLATLIIAVIGLAGRFLGLSFTSVKLIYAFIGLIEILVLVKTQPDLLKKKHDLLKALRKVKVNVPLVAALLIGTAMLINDDLFFKDDWSYLAYLTNWQQASRLHFSEFIYGVNAPDSARFWLALYPMGQALISELSGVPGILLLGNYLELFLVPIAILSAYFLNTQLGLSNRAAGFAVLTHVTLICWIIGNKQNAVGMWFFQSMSEDKVTAAYILAPVLFVFLLMYIKESKASTLVMFSLASLSLMLTHPVILIFASWIALGLVLVSCLMQKLAWHVFAKVLFVLVISFLPFIAIRFSGHPSLETIPYDVVEAASTSIIGAHVDIRQDGFYSVPMEVLKFVKISLESENQLSYEIYRSIPLIVLLIAGLIGFYKIKNGLLYAYLAITISLIFLAMIPYTAWIMGVIVSVRMLYRISWFAPLGLGVIVILKTGAKIIKNQIRPDSKSATLFRRLSTHIPIWGFAFLVILSLGSPIMIDVIRSIPRLDDQLSFHRQLGQLGDYLSNHNPEPVKVITLNGTDNYLPGISASAKPVVFREGKDYMFTPEERAERIKDVQILQSLDVGISWEIRQALLEKYEIQYIVADQQQVAAYQETMNNASQSLPIVFQTDDFVLFRIDK
ncbi:MAG: hypothetical protein JW862_15775 [Anaerolineales bacterium]|nr:hypothetical protein [Anaerolineales bacterium]